MSSVELKQTLKNPLEKALVSMEVWSLVGRALVCGPKGPRIESPRHTDAFFQIVDSNCKTVPLIDNYPIICSWLSFFGRV